MLADQLLRILIVRLSAIGDTIHGLPVLCALRDHLPSARIGWLVEERAAGVLRGHAALDNLLTVPRGWMYSPRSVLAMRRQVRAFRPQITIDMQSLSKSAAPAWLSGAEVRYGFDGVDGRGLSRWLNNRLVRPTAQHVVDRNLQLLEPMGIVRPVVRFDVPRPAEAEASVGRFLRDRGLGGGFAVLNPGAGWASKRWPVERFAALARQLGRDRHLPSVVVWAGNQEWAWADQIITTSGGWAHVAPRTSLLELAELARRARLFVGSDTGPLHLASAVGTPCVGLFGPMPAERNGPYGLQHISLQKICLEGSRRSLRHADNESMRAIDVEEVRAACEQILSRRRPGETTSASSAAPNAAERWTSGAYAA